MRSTATIQGLRAVAAATGFVLATGVAHAQDSWKPGDKVTNAIGIQVTAEGFDEIEKTVNQIVPDLIGGADILAIDDVSIDIPLLGEAYLRNPKVRIDDVAIELEPVAPSFAGAEIRAYLDATIGLNSAIEPYDIRLGFLCNGGGHIKNIRVSTPKNKGGVPITLEVVDGELRVKEIKISGNSIQLGNIDADGGCSFLLETVGNGVSDLLIDGFLIPEINKLLKGNPSANPPEPGLIEDLNDALKALNLDLTGDAAIDLVGLGNPLNIQLNPRRAVTTPAGLEITLDSRIFAAQDPCIATLDPLTSLKTAPLEPPDVSSHPPGTPVAALVSDDLVNQLLYSVFVSGVLCIDLKNDLGGLGLDASLQGALNSILNDSLFFLIGEAKLPGTEDSILDKYTALVDSDATTKDLVLAPTLVPQVAWGVDPAPPVQVPINGLSLNYYTEIEGRVARLVGLGLDIPIGVDVALAGSSLGIELTGLDSIQFYHLSDEFIPGAGQPIADNTKNGLGGIINVAVGGLLGDLAFDIPSFAGIGLGTISLGPSSTQPDWLVGSATVATGLGGDVGCDSSGGGGCDAGCGGGGGGGCGCNSGPGNLGLWALFLTPLVALRRRR